MAEVSFQDFYKVPDIKFDISRLKDDLDKVLQRKKFKSPGVTHFGAISINKIPNDETSVEGNNVRGKYFHPQVQEVIPNPKFAQNLQLQKERYGRKQRETKN